jgi:hypothetical protein
MTRITNWLQTGLRVGLLSAPLLTLASAANAQVGEAGRITARSDVRMAVEGVPGTFGKKLDALASQLGAPLSEVKRCYGELVKQHPEVVGTLDVRIDVPEKGAAKVSAPGAIKELSPMNRCVDKAFAKLDVSQVPRPAGVRLTLDLTNSSASSVHEVREQEARARKVELVQGEGGVIEATGASLGGEVRYVVRGKGKSAEQLVGHLANEVRDALPGLFDCRRRASKLASPEGDIVLKLKLAGSGPLSTETVSSTVKNERAPICVSAALRRNVARELSGAVDLVVHFAPPKPSDNDDG